MPAPLKRLVLILLVFSPAFFTARLVWEKAADGGCWDMWENAPLLQKWHDFRSGKVCWGDFGHDLYSAQIQRRIARLTTGLRIDTPRENRGSGKAQVITAASRHTEDLSCHRILCE